MTTKRTPRKPKAPKAPEPIDPTCAVSVGAPILPVGVQFSTEVPFSVVEEATVKLVELARRVEPKLGLTEDEQPRADHVPGMGAVEVVDDDAWDARRRRDRRQRIRRVGFTPDE